MKRKQTALTDKERKAAEKNLEELQRIKRRMERAVGSDLILVTEWWLECSEHPRKHAAKVAIDTAIDALERLLFEGCPVYDHVYGYKWDHEN